MLVIGDGLNQSEAHLIGTTSVRFRSALLEQCTGVRQIIEVGEGSSLRDLLGSLPNAETRRRGRACPRR